MRKTLFAIAICLLLLPAAYAQETQTKNTLKLNAGQKGAAAKISTMAWLAGTWRGTGLGGQFEEIWSESTGAEMMGMFRMLESGKPVFYEFMTLSEKDGTLMIRLKHFHANFVGWEEKDKFVDFPFIKAEGKRIFFDGMTFELVGENDVNVFVAIDSRDGSTKEALFTYKRAK